MSNTLFLYSDKSKRLHEGIDLPISTADRLEQNKNNKTTCIDLIIYIQQTSKRLKLAIFKPVIKISTK